MKFALSLLALLAAAPPANAPLALQQTLVLHGVSGKFDHFSFDEATNRLFAAAAGNHSVEVLNLVGGTTEQSIGGFGKPHGITWVPESGRLFVADGSKGELDVLTGSPFRVAKHIPLSEDADDMVYDAAQKLLYVGHGGTDANNPSAVAVIQTDTLTLVKDIPVAAHPEALEIDAKGGRIFANIADKGEIVVIDARTQQITAKWQLAGAKGNTPLAYDELDDRLLVGCRTPAKLLLLDARNGKQIASAAAHEGADDLFYNARTRQAYLITGAGWVNSYALSPQGELQSLPATATAPGAKTGLFLPSKDLMVVGIPGVGSPAELRIYATGGK